MGKIKIKYISHSKRDSKLDHEMNLIYQEAWGKFHRAKNIHEDPKLEDFDYGSEIILAYLENCLIGFMNLGYFYIPDINLKMKDVFLSHWSPQDLQELISKGGVVQTTTRLSVLNNKDTIEALKEVPVIESFTDLIIYSCLRNITCDRGLDVVAGMLNGENRMKSYAEKLPGQIINPSKGIRYKESICKISFSAHYLEDVKSFFDINSKLANYLDKITQYDVDYFLLDEDHIPIAS